MARRKELSAVQVGRITTRGLHAVGGVTGLYLQVAAGGSRSWILRAVVGSKRRDIGLGGYPSVTLAQARESARAARQQIRKGIDPVQAREDARQALIAAQAQRMTFRQAAIAKHASIVSEFRNAKHRKDWLSSLELHAYPKLGAMDVADIETAHVLDVLKPIWVTKTETATRVRQRMESVLSWATVGGYRSGDNPARWAGNLEELLPKPSRVATRGRMRALPWQEVPAFMAALAKREGTGARALEFAILCAARSGEVRGMRWDELDGNLWKIPGARMKAGKLHVVPLSDRAMSIIAAQPRMTGSPYVFASPRGGQVSDMTLSAVCRRMGVDATPHGFRASFKSWAQQLMRKVKTIGGEKEVPAYADEVSELALAHVSTDATRAAYARDMLVSQRAKMLQEWARFCSEPFVEEEEGPQAEVVQLRGAAA